MEDGDMRAAEFTNVSSFATPLAATVPQFPYPTTRTHPTITSHYSTRHEFARAYAMEGSARHEARPLDPNPRDLFDASKNPFVFSPGQLVIQSHPESVQAFRALARPEGLQKDLRASQENGFFHGEVASDRNAFAGDDASLVSTWEDIDTKAICQATPQWLSQDGNKDTTERKLAAGCLNGRNISGTNKLETTPKPSLFSMAWEISPVALVLLAFGVMLLILDGCYQSAMVNLSVPEPALPVMASLLILLSVVSFELDSKHWRFEEKKKQKLIRRAPDHSEPTDVAPSSGIACAEFAVAACDEYVVADHDEFSLAGEFDLLRKPASDDMYKALNEAHVHRGLKRAGRMKSFIVPGGQAVGGGTSLVTAFGQRPRSRQSRSSLSVPTPIEEGIVHQGPIDDCLALFGAFLNIILNFLCLSDAPTKLAGDAKNSLGAIFKIDLKEYCALVLLAITYPNSNSATVSHDFKLSPFLMLGVIILQHRRRLKPVLDQIQSSYQSVVSNAKRALSTDARHRRRTHCKPAFILLALLHGAPAAAVAWAPVRALRIASGLTASSAAAAVIPLRTIDGVPSWAWISDYAVWMMCFAMYLTLQVHQIPRHRDHRRQLYLFLVILLAIHFAIALAQSSPTLIDGFTIFGPIVLTITTFLMALLFGAMAAMETRGGHDGVEENASGTLHHPPGIAMAAAMGMCA